MKVACTVWIGGKNRDYFKVLPIDITVIVGMPGSGKTFAMLNIAANCLGMGQRVIVLDPKDDFIKLYNVNKNVRIIDVKNITPGALNPFKFLASIDKDGNEIKFSAASLLTITEILVGQLDQETRTSITPYVRDYILEGEKNPDKTLNLQKYADFLLSRENAKCREIAQGLKIYEDYTYGKLLFTRDNVDTLDIKADESIIISFLGLPLPPSDRPASEYKTEDKFSAAILYIICSKLNQILGTNDEYPTNLFCDEAHILFSNKDLASVIENILRLGRSRNIATVLATQTITNFPDSIMNSISTKFMFKSTLKDAQEFLERFDTSKFGGGDPIDVDSLLGQVTNFVTGQCFMIDRSNRNGIIKIVSIYDPKLLTSNPFMKTEVKYDE